MCGIAGFCDFTKKSTKQTLENMTDVLNHRGPDDSGYSYYENNYCNIGLGHRRLSIMDLSKHGHQPMKFNNLEIIYNGEVYNFKEIRKELEKYNYTFESDSDTEVILKAYHKWGIKAVDKFNGMFAISIYDKESEKLILIRDRTGIKPYYYYNKNNLFMFSSELKSFYEHSGFHKEIDNNALGQFLMYGYILEPYSIFKYTYKIRAGHYIEVDLASQNIDEIKYWDVADSYAKSKLNLNDNEAIKELDTLLISSFRYRMVSDVPVGVFLSGGYDSSAVAAILQNNTKEKINTFTIGFKEKGFDEAVYAKQVAKHLGTNHTEYYCTQKDALEIIPTLAEIYDEPFGDGSAIPTILVSKLAKQDVTVSLSADGGDEIFAGYNKYDISLKYHKAFNKLPNIIRRLTKNSMDVITPKYIPFTNKIYNFKTKYEKIKNLLSSTTASLTMKQTSHLFTISEVNNLLNKDFREKETNFDKDVHHFSDLEQMLLVDYKTYLPDDILTKVDRATMSVSLEGREPLLDYRIIEFAARLPNHLKYRNGEKKWILKQVVHTYLPKEIMDRPKMGFGVPLMEWFRDELKEMFLYYLDEQRLRKENIFNVKEIIYLRDSFLDGKNSNARKLWNILMFEMWYERWM
jgi:asparagine synthase (glutamine-hydrolysing)